MKPSKSTLRSIPSSLSDSPLTEAEKLTEQASEQGDKIIPWSHFIYKIWWNFRRLFSNPFKEKKKELRLLDQVGILISEGDANQVADVCEKYISLHRIVENTRARRRLEKWVTRLIVGYLAVVGVLLLGDSVGEWLKARKLPYLAMDVSVAIALLTTTTVNIVALGIILVRGLFHEHETKDLKQERTKE